MGQGSGSANQGRGGTEYSVLSTRYSVLSAQYLVLSIQYSVPRAPYSAAARWLLLLLLLVSGCDHDESSIGRVEAVWGRPGTSDGRFQTPRAIAIDGDDQLYIVDKTARIQVFKTDGTFLRSWSTPDHANGKPTGLSFDRDGNLMVADTHYFQVLVYSPDGDLLRTLGGGAPRVPACGWRVGGEKPGEFGFVTGTAQDAQGNLYVSEYGEYDRIQKFSPTAASCSNGAVTVPSLANSSARRRSSSTPTTISG